MRIQFMEEGTAENPFSPRSWSLVPRVGETVLLPETGRVYRVLAVQWNCVQRADGSYDDDEPVAVVRVAD